MPAEPGICSSGFSAWAALTGTPSSPAASSAVTSAASGGSPYSGTTLNTVTAVSPTEVAFAPRHCNAEKPVKYNSQVELTGVRSISITEAEMLVSVHEPAREMVAVVGATAEYSRLVDVPLKRSPYGGCKKQPPLVVSAAASKNATKPFFMISPLTIFLPRR